MRKTTLSALLATASSVSAKLEVDLNSPDSIKAAAKNVALDLMSYYNGNQPGQIPGVLSRPPPIGDYYWWHGAVVWSTLLDYWRYTGDDTYNDLTSQAILFQAGERGDFMHPNWTASLGNDDQATWALTALSAAEYNFPNPPSGQPSWIDLAGTAFATQVDRFDDTCNGGLRWQIPPTNAGYGYKNTLSNAAFINLAARLSRYTGNKTYTEAAERTWTWLEDTGFIDDSFNVFDGGHVENNCSDVNKAQFSINAGYLLQSAAYLYNSSSGSDLWRERLSGLTNRTLNHFFPDNGTFVELACERSAHGACTVDMEFFRGVFVRQLATVSQLAPHTSSLIAPKLKVSAEGAVKSCDGGENGRLCGFRWTEGNPNNTSSFPYEANALSALSALLFDSQKALATGSNPVQDGTNSGNNNGNGNGSNNNNGQDKSGGAATQVTVGLLVAGLIISLF
ncbi:glycoside hydrolase [Podospora fimiseda]|uniref:Mannan endo-1,6-alpha-mannosidase n=1 Tax=Podospora fimiseda TaxID=252190 RepID=A0AAN7GXH8_9PEZI|nr:glycoside hydrolase [Podospora fimiseda]